MITCHILWQIDIFYCIRLRVNFQYVLRVVRYHVDGAILRTVHTACVFALTWNYLVEALHASLGIVDRICHAFTFTSRCDHFDNLVLVKQLWHLHVTLYDRRGTIVRLTLTSLRAVHVTPEKRKASFA